MKTFEANQALPFAQHAFGMKTGAATDVEQNIRLLTERLGPIAHMRQVHGDRIAYAARGGLYEECDALYTDRGDLWLAVKSADCVPVLISCAQAVAAVHAGWRGLQQNIVGKTVELLVREFNLDPIDLFVHIGPCIRQYNYEVKNDVAAHFPEKYSVEAQKRGHRYLDLSGVVINQLNEYNVPDLNVYDVGMCTFDKSDKFFSYRRGKQAKKGWVDGSNQLSLVKLQRAKY